MEQPTTPRPNSRFDWLVLAAVGLPGLAALLLALLPIRVFELIAAGLAHADDVTPQRVTRLRIVGGAIALLHLALFTYLRGAGRTAARQFLSTLSTDLRFVRPADGLRNLVVRLTQPGWLHFIVLAFVMTVAVLIRLRYLQIPMDYDEAYSFLNFAQRPLYEALSDYNSTNNHLLNTLWMHMGHGCFGPEEWALRLGVFIAGIGAVGATYVLGRCCVGPEIGLLAAASAATSYVMVNYSVNARGYIWTAWMTTLLILAFWRIARSGQHLAIDWLIATSAAVLGMWALPTMVVPIAGCTGWLTVLRWRQRKGESPPSPGAAKLSRLVGIVVWLFFVGLIVLWLYAPALIFQGTLAWQHPFVKPQWFQDWLSRMPAAIFLATRSWAEGPIPWFVVMLFGALGIAGLWILSRQALWLLLCVPLATLVLMLLQRVTPPPRVLSFLAPLFCLFAAAGVFAVVKLIAIPDRGADRPKSDQTVRTLCSWIACGLCVWGYFTTRNEPLPGGLRPAFLVEDVQRVAAGGLLSELSIPTQQWRLDVKEAVRNIQIEYSPNARMRVLVGLPADMPFRFYAARSGLAVPIGGDPKPGEWLFLIIRSSDSPVKALQENLSLKQIEHPWVLAAPWQLLVAGDLAIWLAGPGAGGSTPSTDP
jgi:hypothetical protein